jgi:hypothetical protein
MQPTRTTASAYRALAAASTLLAALALGCSSGSESIGTSEDALSSRNNVEALYTISYAPNSFVIGNAYPAWTDSLHESPVFQAGPGNQGGVNYQCGDLYGENFDHCGWIARDVVGGSADDASCDSDCPRTYDTDVFRSTYTDGTINPDVSDGSPTHMHYAGSGCTDHNGYGNVDPWKVPATPANSLGAVEDGHLLLWRYASRGGGWVLVHDPANDSRSSTVPNWYFVQRGCVSLEP